MIQEFSRARWLLGWTGGELVEERTPEDKGSKESPEELEVRHGQGRGGTHASPSCHNHLSFRMSKKKDL